MSASTTGARSRARRDAGADVPGRRRDPTEVAPCTDRYRCLAPHSRHSTFAIRPSASAITTCQTSPHLRHFASISLPTAMMGAHVALPPTGGRETSSAAEIATGSTAGIATRPGAGLRRSPPGRSIRWVGTSPRPATPVDSLGRHVPTPGAKFRRNVWQERPRGRKAASHRGVRQLGSSAGTSPHAPRTRSSAGTSPHTPHAHAHPAPAFSREVTAPLAPARPPCR